jgi:HSP20 family protein
MSDTENNKNWKPSPAQKELFNEFKTTVDRLFAEKPLKGILQSMDDFFGGSQDRGIPIEVTESKTDYHIKAILPGIKREHIEIEMLRQGVIISVTHRESVIENNESQGLSKRKQAASTRSRRISLSKPIDERKASANHRDGVLEIKVPKLKGKQIAIDD